MSNSEEVHHCKGENYRNSKYKPETLSNNSADGDTTVPMSNSNLSSPITQWREKVQGIVSAIQKNDFTYFVVHHNGQSAPEAITSATIELLENVSPRQRAEEVNMNAAHGPHQFSYEELKAIWRKEGEDRGYNLAIDQLRQSLKEMKGE